MSNLVFDESSSNREASHGYAWWFSGDTFEKAMAEDRKPRKRNLMHRFTTHPGRLTILYFALLGTLSTLLLLSPIATPKGEKTTCTTAFFTAISAISTCGISIVNSTTHWTAFGQGVLIFSVQMGGLGVMTFASLIALAVNHHLKTTQKLLTANELGTTKLGELKGVLAVVIATAFSIEGITFIALFPGLYQVNHGNVRHTLWDSYNNAGFTPDGAGLHVDNWAVGLPILISAFCGTLGFPVLLNLMRSWRMHRPPKRWSLHTKLTLTTTFCIVAASFTWFLVMEWNNKLLFATEGVEPRLWHAMVAAVMPRSSGFDLSWMPGVSDATKVFLSIVMFIGGGSTSTAGGIRVTTFAVILLVCRSAFTGRRDVNAFHRRIHTQAVMTAVAVSSSCLLLVTVVSMAVMAITGCSLCNALFDTCSAFGLGGYSVGVASTSNPAVLYILAATMFIGRLGPLTIAYAVSRPRNIEPVRYPTEQIVVG